MLTDAFAVYQRLFRVSVAVAGLVFVVVGLAEALADRSGTDLTRLVSLVLSLIGGLLVQGAVIQIVRDLHEGRPPAGIRALVDQTRGKLGTLLGATFLYTITVVLRLFLLVVPGLIAFARGALIVPLVMIEGRGASEAFARSSDLVRGRTGRVLALVIVSNLITLVIAFAIVSVFVFLPPFPAIWLGTTLAGALTAPFQAHVVSVLYYRLTDPDRPAVPGLTRAEVPSS